SRIRPTNTVRASTPPASAKSTNCSIWVAEHVLPHLLVDEVAPGCQVKRRRKETIAPAHVGDPLTGKRHRLGLDRRHRDWQRGGQFRFSFHRSLPCSLAAPPI